MRRNWQRLVKQSLPAVLLGALAFVLVILGTESPGPGLDPDAVSYLGAAESLVHTGSYRIPTTEWDSPDTTGTLAHFPPGYSTILAVPIGLGMAPIQAARVVEATAAFVSTVVLVLLVSSAVNLTTAVLLAFALFAMTAMHEVHISVLSEPVYLACTLLALNAMVRWPLRPARAGIPAAVAVMTRYAGASVVAAVAFWSVLQPGSRRDRMRRGVIAVIPSVVLQLLWVIRTHVARDPEDIRDFAIYGKLGPTFAQGLTTLTTWLVPDPASDTGLPYRGTIALAFGAVLVALAAMGAAWFGWGGNHERVVLPRRLLSARGLLLVCYLGVLLASRLLADPLIPFDQRLLSPAIMLATIMLAATIPAWWKRTRHMVARMAVGVALVTWWIAAAGATRTEAQYALRWGSDFAGVQWRSSELLAWARKNAAHTPIYTNWPVAVYFHLHRNSHELPHWPDIGEMAAFGDSVRARHGIVLLFGAENGEYVPNDSIYSVPGFDVIKDVRDGSVLAPVAKR